MMIIMKYMESPRDFSYVAYRQLENDFKSRPDYEADSKKYDALLGEFRRTVEIAYEKAFLGDLITPEAMLVVAKNHTPGVNDEFLNEIKTELLTIANGILWRVYLDSAKLSSEFGNSKMTRGALDTAKLHANAYGILIPQQVEDELMGDVYEKEFWDKIEGAKRKTPEGVIHTLAEAEKDLLEAKKLSRLLGIELSDDFKRPILKESYYNGLLKSNNSARDFLDKKDYVGLRDELKKSEKYLDELESWENNMGGM